MRGGGAAVPVSGTKATFRPGAALAAGPGRASAGSSEMVFHSPQASQRPAHLPVAAPQVAQRKRGAGLAKAGDASVVVGGPGPVAVR